MEPIFLKILEMSITGSACILSVLALRMFLRRKPRSFSYVLWAVVFLRLLCPFALQSRYFGLDVGNMERTLETAAYEQELIQYQLLVHKDGSVEALASRNVPGTPVASLFPLDGQRVCGEAWGTDRDFGAYSSQRDGGRYSRSAVRRLERGWVSAGSLIWTAGLTVLLGYSLISYILLRRRLVQAVQVQKDVYESDRINTPFLLGILDPRIYLPPGLSQEERAFVLAHELVHLKRGDYLVKMVTWFALSLHWFNPLVWLAYGLMARDMEMSCDERVISRLGEGCKKAYSRALLTISGISGENEGTHSPVSAPLGFGENDIGSRVKNILAYRGVKLGTGVALGLILALLGLILLTDWRAQGGARTESVVGVDVSSGKQQDNGMFETLEEVELPVDSSPPGDHAQLRTESGQAVGTDRSEGGGHYLIDGEQEALEERTLDPADGASP